MNVSRAIILFTIATFQAGVAIGMAEDSGKPHRRSARGLEGAEVEERGWSSSSSSSSSHSWTSSKSSKSKSWWKSTDTPTLYPTVSPTLYPTVSPTLYPTVSPTLYPTVSPTYCGKAGKSGGGKSGSRKLGSWSSSWSSPSSTSCDKGPRPTKSGKSGWKAGRVDDPHRVFHKQGIDGDNSDVWPEDRNRRHLASGEADHGAEPEPGKMTKRRQIDGVGQP